MSRSTWSRSGSEEPLFVGLGVGGGSPVMSVALAFSSAIFINSGRESALRRLIGLNKWFISIGLVEIPQYFPSNDCRRLIVFLVPNQID